MSVPTDKRKPSLVQFVTTAQELFNYTTDKLVKLPGRYKDYVYARLSNSVGAVVDDVTKANGLSRDMMPDYSQRRALFKDAQAELIIASKYIDYIMLSCNRNSKGETIISEAAKTKWFTLIKQEQSLIGGILESDRKAYAAASKKHGDNVE